MTSIKCGNCTSTHESAQEVRACYATGRPTATATDAAFAGLAEAFPANRRQQAAGRTRSLGGGWVLNEAPKASSVAPVDAFGTSSVQADAATERQQSFIASLRSERGVEGTFVGTKKEASAEISRLLALPKTAPAAKASTTPQDAVDVPAGRYAIEVDGVVKFYRVDRPTEGRWAGYTFVKVQASDDLHPVRGTAAQGILKAIAVDPREASLRYGREIGSCGVCGRTLTDEDSRNAGIGPVCASKTGW